MPDRHRIPADIEILYGTRDALQFLLSEVDGAGNLDDAADAIRTAIAAVEAGIRRRLS